MLRPDPNELARLLAERYSLGHKLRSEGRSTAMDEPLDLSGMRLAGFDLAEHNLVSANLQGADLREADLYGAHLRWANLDDAILDGALMVKANLDDSRARGASFVAADLTRTDFNDADISGASFHRALLLGTAFWDSDLRGADLREATFWGAHLNDVHLEGIDTTGAAGFLHPTSAIVGVGDEVREIAGEELINWLNDKGGSSLEAFDPVRHEDLSVSWPWEPEKWKRLLNRGYLVENRRASPTS